MLSTARHLRDVTPADGHGRLADRHAAAGGLLSAAIALDVPHLGTAAWAVGYWMTCVAWSRMCWGMVRPRACAVLRLMTKSNSRGCSTGRSAGLAPSRMRPTVGGETVLRR